ncbi:APC family permease [Longispora sp. NPDC051575]|uniref:APC family permease n=1 Tax=Longispora sp. NPDC051575 TaxID=3154943 RepID=UPI00341BC3E2
MSSPPVHAQRLLGSNRASSTLRSGQLGTATLVWIMLSAAATLTVTAGVIPTGFASTGLVALPLAFLAVGVVLAVFLPGYLAMARHLPSAGGMYTFVAAGLGRVPGVGAAWLAVVFYMAVQTAAYGLIGAAVVPLLDGWWGVSPPWWTAALACWAVVGLLGVRRISLSGRVLAVLCAAELAVVAVTASSNVATAATDNHPMLQPWAGLDPARMLVPALGAALVVIVLAFAGFEHGVVYAEEARPGAVARATCITLLVLTVLYAGASCAMLLPAGPVAFMDRAGELGPDLVATVAGEQLGSGMAMAVRVLFVSSLLAAMMAFHQTSSRYLFSLGREHVAPARLGRLGPRSGAPVAASLVQTAVIGAVILTYAAGGWDPVTRLFYIAGTAGGFGVLVLLAGTSAAVIGYFTQRDDRPGVWARLIAPGLSGLGLVAMVCLAVANFAAVLGVPGDSPLGWAVPTALALLVAGGCGWGLTLRLTAPHVYRRIGHGVRAGLDTTALD